MKRSGNSLQGLYAIGVTALFLAGFFLLVVFGARVYRDILSVREQNNAARAQLSGLQTILRAGDEAGGITVDEYGSGALLRVADGDTGYGTLLYAEDGELLQEYTLLTADPDPDLADVIAETDTFTAVRDGRLLTVAMDAGSVTVCLRGEGGDAGE